MERERIWEWVLVDWERGFVDRDVGWDLRMEGISGFLIVRVDVVVVVVL